MMQLADYETMEDGLRVIDADTIKYKLILDRTLGLWGVETSTGPVPVALRGMYTAAREARQAVMNYLAEAPDRKITYKNTPKTKD